MDRNIVGRRTALILIYGHILLFLYGVLIALFNTGFASDIIQMILMGSPLLAVVSLTGFQWLFGLNGEEGQFIDSQLAFLVQFICALFILLMFLAYTSFLIEFVRIDVDYIKLSVGAIETGLGAYVGIIRDRLFQGDINE